MLDTLINIDAPEGWSVTGGVKRAGVWRLLFACPGAFPFATARPDASGRLHDVERYSTMQVALKALIDDQ